MKKMDKADKEQKIFQAALSLFAHFGYRKTTVEDVAVKVGMTKSNIYFYVKNKQDLYEKSVSHALEKWRDTIAAEIETVDSAKEKFAIAAGRSFEYLEDHGELRALLIKDPDIFTLSPSEDRFYEVNRGAMMMLKAVIQQGIDEGVFYPVDVDHVTEFLFSVYIMFLIKTYVKSDGSSSERMYEEGLALIFRGLCKT
ncbi:MAG: TetR/AcrR family transcriptional regulator [Desulfobacteraceae bacterium]|nr:TetR/AcrR family transcriptional regulator [Desulfobacteraceae bacterium]MBC2757328.1 TetR/AcrR family transcriptional regulator [Desulfobacteraceae bacterium]